MGKTVDSGLQAHLQQINDQIVFLMDLFEIPESRSAEIDVDEFLTPSSVPARGQLSYGMEKPAKTAQELEDRVSVMKNKIASRHLQRKARPDGEKNERKKLKREQRLKKKLKRINVSAVKLDIKSGPATPVQAKLENGKGKPLGPMFNPEAKIVFSKFQLDDSDTKKRGIETDAKKLLKKVLKEKQELSDLKAGGDLEKYHQVKQKKAWEKAMAKASGEKVRDDPELLVKKIQKRKTQILKSKQEWKDRKEKIEQKQSARQKQRTANIKERVEKKKNKKMKQLSKKGRIIPGF